MTSARRRNRDRITFLRREVARDIDAAVAQGVDRAWLTRVVEEAAEELARRTFAPTAAERATDRRDEDRMRRGYRRHYGLD